MRKRKNGRNKGGRERKGRCQQLAICFCMTHKLRMFTYNFKWLKKQTNEGRTAFCNVKNSWNPNRSVRKMSAAGAEPRALACTPPIAAFAPRGTAEWPPQRLPVAPRARDIYCLNLYRKGSPVPERHHLQGAYVDGGSAFWCHHFRHNLPWLCKAEHLYNLSPRNSCWVYTPETLLHLENEKQS